VKNIRSFVCLFQSINPSSEPPSERNYADHWSDPERESWSDSVRKKIVLICEERSFISMSVCFQSVKFDSCSSEVRKMSFVY